MAYITLNVKNKVFEQGVHYQTSPFGMRDGYMHQGIDMIGKAYAGDNIVAFADGIVYVNAYDDSRGNYIVLKHSNGTETHYYHMRNRSTLAQGVAVKKGQVLGYMGTTGNSTGPHLHFGIRIGGSFVNPLPYLEGKSVLIPVPKPVVPKPVSTPAQKPAKKSIDDIAHEVIKGLWGNGDDRKKRFTNAGYDYSTVQARVETLLHPSAQKSAPKPAQKPIAKPAVSKKTVDQLAREVIRGDWGNGNIRKQRLEKAGYNYKAVQSAVNKLC